MSTYPANITIKNAVYTPPGAYQKDLSLTLPGGGVVHVAPGASFTINVPSDGQSVDIAIGPFNPPYPDGSTPAAPGFQFDYTNPKQAWHGVWSDAPGTRLPISAFGVTSCAFNAPDDARVFTLTPGRL